MILRLRLLLLFTFVSILCFGQNEKTKSATKSIFRNQPKIRIDFSDMYTAAEVEIDENKKYLIQTAVGLKNRFIVNRGTKVEIGESPGSSQAHWQIRKKDDGKYLIYQEYSRGDWCLNSDYKVIRCDNRYSQDWEILRNIDGTYSFKSRNRQEFLALALPSTQLANNYITVHETNSENRTRWILQPKDEQFELYHYSPAKIVTNICLTNVVRGDREFGRDPSTSFEVKLIPSTTSILAEISVKMWGDNQTFVFQERTENILSFAPIRPNNVVGQILSPNYLRFEITPEGHGEHELVAGRDFPSDSPVRRIILRGDTMGNDISDDRDCSDDAEIILIEFNPILLKSNRVW